MAEELRALGVPFPNLPAIVPPATDQPEVQFWTAKEPEARLFLDQLICDHREDYAYQVCTPPVNCACFTYLDRTLSHL